MCPEVVEAYDKKKKIVITDFNVFTENDKVNATFFLKSKYPRAEIRVRSQIQKGV